MKKNFYGMAVVLTFFLVSSAHGDYLIKMKNGRSLETPKYWEEKDEINFQWENGVASLPKKNILSIERAEEKAFQGTPKDQKPSDAIQEVPAETKEAPAVEKEKSAASPATSKEVDVAYYKKQKAYYTEQFNQAYQRYLDATSRRDEEAKKKAWEEFNRFGGKVVSMETELREKNNGVVPQWWKEQGAETQ